MKVRPRSPRRSCRPFARTVAACLMLAGAVLLGGCASGDFGRVRPSLVADDIHAWLGAETAAFHGGPVSAYPLTDDERLLRDLAYPLIAPPYDQAKWFSLLEEYGNERYFHRDWWIYDRRAYSVDLATYSYRSAAGRYGQLVTDARNDITRIPPFFSVARRVIDMDNRRIRSLSFVSGLTEPERVNALARVAENRCIVAWVERALIEREASYRYALERLVIAEPSPSAAEADRVLTQLKAAVAGSQIIPPLVIPRVVPRAVPLARVVISTRG